MTMACRDGKRLRVVVAGAGVAGLTASIALARRGHYVTVLEAKATIETLGAGIQVAPNMSRLLQRLGVSQHLESDIVKPRTFILRRWNTGECIGGMTTGDFEDEYGSPYIQVHRGDLHHALVLRAQELSVQFRTDAPIVAYDLDRPTVTLASGEVVEGDLLVAADGVRSLARQRLTGLQGPPPEKADFVAYRNALEIDRLKEDPILRHLVEEPHQNCWIGGDHHVQIYSMGGNKQLNLVWVAPISAKKSHSESLVELKEQFAGWDPRLQRLMDMVKECGRWPVWMAVHLERTVADSGKFIAIGDAAHDMTPFLGQGAAMAVEDGALLGHLLSPGLSPCQIGDALRQHEQMRLPRTARIKQEALRNCELWHLKDGERQRRRDAQGYEAFVHGSSRDSPYIWSHPEGRRWLYGYDVEAATGLGEAVFQSQWD